ncbi:MAG TPA: 4Fe-4S binding protein [Syntrophales bacterium]|nr:4Fe-4S binding protein [Syntrophales bacterium]
MEEDHVYHQLRREIDTRMPVGMPASEDHSEIDLLKRLFTPEEAALAVHLSVLPEPLKKLHKRLKKAGMDLPEERLERMLDGMVGKGVIFGGKMFPKPKHYSLGQFAVGMYEFQVDRQTREMAEKAEKYMHGTFYREFFRKDRPLQMRTIPVAASIAPEYRVSPYDDILELVRRAPEPIVVVDCVCKQSKDLLKEPCRLSDIRNNCMLFGSAAEFVLEREVPSARSVTRKELLSLLEQFRNAGLVLQPANTRDPSYICACCGCCCNILQGFKKFPRPAEYFHSSYQAIVDVSSCTGCEACVPRCQMEALSVDASGRASVNPDRCIGCGNCMTVCPVDAVKLAPLAGRRVPPRSHEALYLNIARQKFGVLGMLKMAARAAAGKKV